MSTEHDAIARQLQAAFTRIADQLHRDIAPLADQLAARTCNTCGITHRPSQNHTHTHWERLKARLGRRSQT